MYTKTKLAFETHKLKGFTLKAWYVSESVGDALIELFREGELVREMSYPAYKIWNLAAHFEEIVESELNADTDGYAIAGSDGLGGGVMPVVVQKGGVTE